MFTLHDSPEWVETALSVGARGYLLKSDAEGELLHALEVLADDGFYARPVLGRDRIQRLIVELRLPQKDVH